MSSDRAGVRLRRGRVTALRDRRPGALEVDVELQDGPATAIAFPDLVGPVVEGDLVILNTSSVHLGLGTGGFHLLVAVEGGPDTELRASGRTMKARYTPAQVAVTSVEETHGEALEGSAGLGGVPVVCAPLHSMVAPIAAGARVAGANTIVYVMTDGAALPGALSRLVPRLRGVGLLDGWITCGQAFGGELEAITIWTGLLAAVQVLHADVVIVADGPGNLGSETTWGVSGLASGHALNAVETLRGRPVAALRISFADERERHRGVSHHSLTILERVTTARVNVAVPTLERDEERERVWKALRERMLEERHQLVEADGRPALAEMERLGLEVRTMGRTIAEDPMFFLAAGAGGVLAGRMAVGSRAYRSS